MATNSWFKWRRSFQDRLGEHDCGPFELGVLIVLTGVAQPFDNAGPGKPAGVWVGSDRALAALLKTEHRRAVSKALGKMEAAGWLRRFPTHDRLQQTAYVIDGFEVARNGYCIDAAGTVDWLRPAQREIVSAAPLIDSTEVVQICTTPTWLDEGEVVQICTTGGANLHHQWSEYAPPVALICTTSVDETRSVTGDFAPQEASRSTRHSTTGEAVLEPKQEQLQEQPQQIPTGSANGPHPPQEPKSLPATVLRVQEAEPHSIPVSCPNTPPPPTPAAPPPAAARRVFRPSGPPCAAPVRIAKQQASGKPAPATKASAKPTAKPEPFDPLDYVWNNYDPIGDFDGDEACRIVFWALHNNPKPYWRESGNLTSEIRITQALPTIAKQVPADYTIPGWITAAVPIADPACTLCGGQGSTVQPDPNPLYPLDSGFTIAAPCRCLHVPERPWEVKARNAA